MLYPSHGAPAGSRPNKLGVFLALETSEPTVQFPGRKGAPVIKHRGDVPLPVEHRVQESLPIGRPQILFDGRREPVTARNIAKVGQRQPVIPARATSVGTNTSLLGHWRMNGSEPMASRRWCNSFRAEEENKHTFNRASLTWSEG